MSSKNKKRLCWGIIVGLVILGIIGLVLGLVLRKKNDPSPHPHPDDDHMY